jgi:hypothetical protein
MKKTTAHKAENTASTARPGGNFLNIFNAGIAAPPFVRAAGRRHFDAAAARRAWADLLTPVYRVRPAGNRHWPFRRFNRRDFSRNARR